MTVRRFHRLSLKSVFCGLAIVAVLMGSSIQGARAADLFADLATRLAPAVVNISTTTTGKGAGDDDADAPDANSGSGPDQFYKDFLDPRGDKKGADRSSKALGSGFIIDPSGLVVTNNHVIADADEITVVLQDNTELKAELVGRDVETDLALLRVKPDHPLPAVKFGKSDSVRIGDWVVAVGNPFGLGGTVTSGILSARARQIENSGPYDSFLQTDAAINRGNSGGPLFNLNGDVIGINSAIISPSGGSIGLGFAIPSELADHVIALLKQDGRVNRGYLGARIEGLTDDTASVLGLAKPEGVLIAGVPEGSPARRAGLEPGDIVLSVDGQDVSGVRKLQRVVADASVDRAVPFRLWRKKTMKLVSVKFEPLPNGDDPDSPASRKGVQKQANLSQLKALGLTLSVADPDLRQKFQLDDDAHIVVTGIQSSGPAAGKDIKPGDVLVEVAHEEVKSLVDVTRTVSAVKKSGHKSVLMLIDRGGDLRFVALQMDQG